MLHLTASLSRSAEFPSPCSEKHSPRLTLPDHAGLLTVTSQRLDANGNPQSARRHKVQRAVDKASMATLSTAVKSNPSSSQLRISHYSVN
ncbi:uncharacterized protein V6R79_001750 [Siganus canaliculatus]